MAAIHNVYSVLADIPDDYVPPQVRGKKTVTRSRMPFRFADVSLKDTRDLLSTVYDRPAVQECLKKQMNFFSQLKYVKNLPHNPYIVPLLKLGEDTDLEVTLQFDGRPGGAMMFALCYKHMLMFDWDFKDFPNLSVDQSLDLIIKSLQALCDKHERKTGKLLKFLLLGTDRGLHAYCISHIFKTQSIISLRMMFNSCQDAFYSAFTFNKDAWCDRISPKPASPDDFVADLVNVIHPRLKSSCIGPGSCKKSLMRLVLFRLAMTLFVRAYYNPKRLVPLIDPILAPMELVNQFGQLSADPERKFQKKLTEFLSQIEILWNVIMEVPLGESVSCACDPEQYLFFLKSVRSQLKKMHSRGRTILTLNILGNEEMKE